MPALGRRSRAITKNELPEVRWEHSHVVVGDEGLVRSYGPQKLRIFKMKPELGPPEVEELDYASEDGSWLAEWRHFREAIATGKPTRSSPVTSSAPSTAGWSMV